MRPVTSAFGRAAAEVFAPSASWTRKWWPAGTEPVRGVVCALVPEADQYCTLHPVRSIAVPEALYSSTKSLRSGAPELPPPPKTSETRTVEDAACAGLNAVPSAPTTTRAVVPARNRRGGC